MGDIFVVYIFKTQCYVLTNGGDDLRGDETVAAEPSRTPRNSTRELTFD